LLPFFPSDRKNSYLKNWVVWHSKYNPKEVLSLYEFYENLKKDARNVKDEGPLMRMDDLRKDQSRLSAVHMFESLCAHGQSNEQITFRQLLEIIYPNANEDDMVCMLDLVSPSISVPASPEPHLSPLPSNQRTSTDEMCDKYEKDFDEIDADKRCTITLSQLATFLQAEVGHNDPKVMSLFKVELNGKITKTNFILGMMRLALSKKV